MKKKQCIFCSQSFNESEYGNHAINCSSEPRRKNFDQRNSITTSDHFSNVCFFLFRLVLIKKMFRMKKDFVKIPPRKDEIVLFVLNQLINLNMKIMLVHVLLN
jgi:uncharacterized membrane protein YvbJ